MKHLDFLILLLEAVGGSKPLAPTTLSYPESFTLLLTMPIFGQFSVLRAASADEGTMGP
jgi:hypothetical protein